MSIPELNKENRILEYLEICRKADEYINALQEQIEGLKEAIAAKEKEINELAKSTFKPCQENRNLSGVIGIPGCFNGRLYHKDGSIFKMKLEEGSTKVQVLRFYPIEYYGDKINAAD